MNDCVVFPFNEEPFIVKVDDFLMSVKVKCANNDYQDRRIGKFQITSPGQSVDYLFAHGYDDKPAQQVITAAIEKLSPQPL